MKVTDNKCGQDYVEFEGLQLLTGTRMAREICRECGGKILPLSPPDFKAERNEKIKKLYFEDGLTQGVIAERFGVSRRWVNQIVCCRN